jgi:hypothetical protein
VLPLVVCVVVSSSSAGIGDMGVMAGLLAGYISQGRLITALVVGTAEGRRGEGRVCVVLGGSRPKRVCVSTQGF